MKKPDFNKEKFTITITVHENCQSFNVQSLNGEPISYQEIIGCLDTVKMSYFFDQSGLNIEEYRKWQRLQDKKKSKNKQSNDPTNSPHK